MSATLTVENFGKTNTLETARLAADASAGSNQLPLDNKQGITANDYLLIGDLGSPTAELAQAQSITGETITLVSPLELRHDPFTPVTRLFGNQVKLYAAPDVDGTEPDISTYTPVTGGTAPIDPDQLMTSVTDVAGSYALWYRFTYLNSTTMAETSLASSAATRGNAIHYADVSEVRTSAGLEHAVYISDATIAQARDSAEDEVNGAIQGQYVVPLKQPINGVIVQIVKQLAAGFILSENSGGNTNTAQNGKDRIADARAQLQKIAAKQIRLLNQVGIDESKGGAGSMIGTGPDTTPMVTVGQKF